MKFVWEEFEIWMRNEDGVCIYIYIWNCRPFSEDWEDEGFGVSDLRRKKGNFLVLAGKLLAIYIMYSLISVFFMFWSLLAQGKDLNA